MEKILCIYSSPTIKSKKGSISTLIAKKFLNEYKKKFANCEIIEINLNNEDIGKKTLTANNFSTFFDKTSDKLINQLKNVNKLIVAAPMINFNYPAVLKNYLDHILVANKTFVYKYNRNGQSEGLVKGLIVQLITTQGADFGWYPWGNHTHTLKGTFEFIGAKVLKPITIFGTKTPKKIDLPIEQILNSCTNEINDAVNTLGKAKYD